MSSSKKFILIVDDDKDIRDSLSELLAESGYQVNAAENGQTALDLLRSNGLPGVIFLDLMMPVKDGFQFRQEQLQDARIAHIPVVVMTADGHTDAKKERVGATFFLRKPVEMETVLEIVQQYC